MDMFYSDNEKNHQFFSKLFFAWAFKNNIPEYLTPIKTEILKNVELKEGTIGIKIMCQTKKSLMLI